MSLISQINSDIINIAGENDDNLQHLNGDFLQNGIDPYNYCSPNINHIVQSMNKCSHYDKGIDILFWFSIAGTIYGHLLNSPSSEGQEFCTTQMGGSGIGNSEWRFVNGNLDNFENNECDRDIWDVIKDRFKDYGPPYKIKCQRKSFQGDPFRCCLKDLACDNRGSSCYEDSNFNLTCDPEHRDAGGTQCLNIIENLCTGQLEGYEDYISLWTTKNSISYTSLENSDRETNTTINFNTPICQNLLYRGIYGNKCQKNFIPGLEVDPVGYQWGKRLISSLLDKYRSENGDLYNTSVLLKSVEDICKNIPGLCSDYLSSYCRNYDSTIINNPELLKWCGCYLPEDNYSRYVDSFGISKSCTPLCRNTNNIPAVSQGGITGETCEQQICIIDNLTIQLINSSFQDVEISQICAGCQNL